MPDVATSVVILKVYGGGSKLVLVCWWRFPFSKLFFEFKFSATETILFLLLYIDCLLHKVEVDVS